MMRAFIVTFAVVVLLLIAVGAAFWFGTQNPDAEVAVPEVDVDVTMPNEDTVESPIPTAEDGTPILTPSPQISPTGAPTISPTQTEETTQ